MHYYELFNMLPQGFISNMYTHFIKKTIVTSIHALGREFNNSKIVIKILYYFPKSWGFMVTSIFDQNIYLFILLMYCLDF